MRLPDTVTFPVTAGVGVGDGEGVGVGLEIGDVAPSPLPSPHPDSAQRDSRLEATSAVVFAEKVE